MVQKLKKVKALKGWKTVLFNLGASSPILLDIAGYLLNYPGVQGLIPEQYMGEYALGIGVVNLFLRYITTTPMGEKY
jgi:hypothetical protein